MIQVYPASSRFEYDKGWLKGGHSFSFAEYYDPENVKFGPMRVCNDDVIAPGKGFGAHPHSDMVHAQRGIIGVIAAKASARTRTATWRSCR